MSIRKLNLLVVDDDASIVRLVTKVLTNELSDIAIVHSIADSKEAADWLSAHLCDILITDIEMPGIDGMEILRLAKKRNAWTQVIFMTAHSTWDHIADAMEHGAGDYLLKPINPDELVELVRQECARQFRWKKVIVESLKATVQNP